MSVIARVVLRRCNRGVDVYGSEYGRRVKSKEDRDRIEIGGGWRWKPEDPSKTRPEKSYLRMLLYLT